MHCWTGQKVTQMQICSIIITISSFFTGWMSFLWPSRPMWTTCIKNQPWDLIFSDLSTHVKRDAPFTMVHQCITANQKLEKLPLRIEVRPTTLPRPHMLDFAAATGLKCTHTTCPAMQARSQRCQNGNLLLQPSINTHKTPQLIIMQYTHFTWTFDPDLQSPKS